MGLTRDRSRGVGRCEWALNARRFAGGGIGELFGKGGAMKGKTAIILATTAFLCGSTWGDRRVDRWHGGHGSFGLGDQSDTPVHNRRISFSGPTDKTYGNSCSVESAYGGTPYLSINNSTKTVELKFQARRPRCVP